MSEYLDTLKKRRVEKFGTLPMEELSATTRKFFKQWNHKKEEIVKYEHSQKFKNKQFERRKKGLLKQCSCGYKFNHCCPNLKCAS